MDIKERLFLLSNADGVGNITCASDLAYNMLKEICPAKRQNNLTVMGFLKGKKDYTLMIDAHIDQIAMVVTNVDDNGFLTVENAGGIDIRALPSRRVTVYGKEKISAVFCATPPHLSKGAEEFDSISKIKLDTALGKKANKLISVGDYVTFDTSASDLLENRVCGKSFDDRAAVACLIEVASRLKGEKLPFNVAFLLSDSEELGMRGVRTATFEINPQEAIAVDVGFGDGIGISPEECGKLQGGGMIGISPTLDSRISNKLIKLAKKAEIPYQTEVMSSTTGTNADMISLTRQGVPTGTLSIPIRNMHTDCEILDLCDLDAVCDLLCEYILSGGVMND